MKKVIKGKLYDTSTAKAVGGISYGYQSDFHYYSETLYRKKSGEYFLHGEGGAASRYAKSCGLNEWCGGEEIKPLTYAQAAAWAEEHLDADEYAAAFGMPDEDDDGERRTVGFRISESALLKLKRAVEQTGKTQAEILEELINGNL